MFEMMSAACAASGWFAGVFVLLIVALLVLSAAALIKYLVGGRRPEVRHG